MASRPKGYGLTAEVNRKIAGKYDIELEQEARLWMEEIIGEPLDPNTEPLGMDRFQATLKSGVLLCRLYNCLDSANPIKFNDKSTMAFKQMENIGKFLDHCDKYGVRKIDMFQTVDLYEGQNMAQVVNGIHALGRKAGSKGQKGIGPTEAQTNVREFSEEQLKAGQNVIGLQMGSNKGASQSGQNFGKGRSIVD